MLGEIITLLSALISGASISLVRKRINDSNPINSAFITILVGNVFLWPITLAVTDFSNMSADGILYFIIAGIFSFGIVRLLYFIGIEKVGASINASIWATFPIYSTIFAVIFLNETLSIENYLGVLCIIIGGILIERSTRSSEAAKNRIFKKWVIIPLVGTIIIAISAILRKQGLTLNNEPLFAVAIGYAVALPLHALFVKFKSSRTTRLELKSDLKYFWKSGVGLATTFVLSFYALSLERVAIIAPITQTNALFVILFSYLFLKKLEKITFKLILSAMIILIGVTLLGIS